MTVQQIGNLIGFSQSNKGGNLNRSNINGAGNSNGVDANDPTEGSFDNDMLSMAAMRTRLTAINATTYSVANLNKMTLNDMIYAIRVNDKAAGIKQ